MNREEFVSQVSQISSSLDKKSIMDTICEDIDSLHDLQGLGVTNLIIVMEEFAEMTQQISKSLRGQLDMTGLLEELADVQLSVWYLQAIFGIDDETLNRAINVKVNRAQARTESRKEEEMNL